MSANILYILSSTSYIYMYVQCVYMIQVHTYLRNLLPVGSGFFCTDPNK